MIDPYLPSAAKVLENRPEVPGVVTLVLQLCEQEARSNYRFDWGQFNMLSLPAVGEVPISIMGREDHCLLHTIRGVGRVSDALIKLKPGDKLGLRGPFGNCWPLGKVRGRDLLFITAGLGCAPVLSAIAQTIRDRDEYRRIVILQGVKYRHDLLWERQYQAWRSVPDCQVLLAASEEHHAAPQWSLGMVTVLLEKALFDPERCAVMMCGPEPMLVASMKKLLALGVAPEACYLSLERNMQCGFGHCGHCQLGDKFLCRDGPIFNYPTIRQWLEHRGV